MGKFKKGVRVRLIEDHDYSATAGMVGTIVGKDEDGDRDIVFDNFTDGHCGLAFDGSTNHWFVPKSKLEVVEEEPITELPFAVGDSVRLTAVNTHAHWGEAGETGTVEEIDVDIGARVAFERNGLWWAPFDLLEATDAWVPKVGDRVNVIYGHGWEGPGVVTRGRGAAGIISVRMETGKFADDEGGFDVADLHPLPVAAEAQPAAPLTIQAGRYYKTRDGRKVGPMEDYPGTAWDDQEALLKASIDGENRLFRVTSGIHLFGKTNFDLIAEWTEADEPVVAVEEVEPATKLDFAVGDRVKSTGNTWTKYKVLAIRGDVVDVVTLEKDGSESLTWPDQPIRLFSLDVEPPVAVAEATATPKFKVGDRVGDFGRTQATITSVVGDQFTVVWDGDDESLGTLWTLDDWQVHAPATNDTTPPANDNDLVVTITAKNESVADALHTLAAALNAA